MTEPHVKAVYRIGKVAELVGLSEHSLRAWERRYAAVEPERSERGGRRYTQADVERLRRLKILVDDGHPIGTVAPLPDEDLERMLAARRPAPSGAPIGDGEELRSGFLEAVEKLDVATAERQLLRVAMISEPGDLVRLVVAPLLEEVGERWESGEFGIAQEHAASAAVRNVLGSLLRIWPAEPGAPTVVATTPRDELHELGALMAALLAALHGYRVVYLGPNVPADEIRQAVRNSGATFLLLSVVMRDGKGLRREIREITRELPPQVRTLIGGRGAKQLRASAGITIVDLDSLEAHLGRR